MNKLAIVAALAITIVFAMPIADEPDGTGVSVQQRAITAAGDPILLNYIAGSKDCGELQLMFTQELSVWKSGVRKSREEPEHLEHIRAILRRLFYLQSKFHCGG